MVPVVPVRSADGRASGWVDAGGRGERVPCLSAIARGSESFVSNPDECIYVSNARRNLTRTLCSANLNPPATDGVLRSLQRGLGPALVTAII